MAIDYFERIGLPFVVAVNRFEGRSNLASDQVRAATDVDPDVLLLQRARSGAAPAVRPGERRVIAVGS